MSNYKVEIAKALLDIGAVGFKPKDPITFKSGIKSPVYVDNRRFPFNPSQWAKVIQGFQDLIKADKIDFDVIAGIETAGIPHSAALGFAMQKPSVFVRKQVKDHGTKSRIEGGKVEGKKVLLIEDLVTTGGSSLSGVEALRTEGAVVNDCLVIISYGFPVSVAAFKEAKVGLHALTSFNEILEEALSRKMFSESEMAIIKNWLSEPKGWAKRQGFES
jgi:orotate phosphoribosyltransferase